MKWSSKLSCLSAVINDQSFFKAVARPGEVIDLWNNSKVF